MKVVRDMPSERAVLVMRSAKALSLPEIFSPMAAATSLAESVTSALIASSTLNRLAGLDAELGRRHARGTLATS